ncbi:hypothetical protein BH09PAT1_BH09PAT1_6300 [soil metagenome]
MATRGDSGGGGYTYLCVKHHSICEESKTPKDGFEEVEVFNPKTKETLNKYIDKWGSVSGFVNSVEHYDTGTSYETRFQGFKINIDDEVILDLPQKTPAYDTFCKVAENIDWTKEVSFSAYHNKKKDRTAFSVKQDGEGVDWKYTIENPGDCPPWEKDEDGEWDSRKQRAFLKQRVIDDVIPVVLKAATERAGEFDPSTAVAPVEAPKASAASAGKAKGSTKTTTPAPDDDDNIPF